MGIHLLCFFFFILVLNNTLRYSSGECYENADDEIWDFENETSPEYPVKNVTKNIFNANDTDESQRTKLNFTLYSIKEDLKLTVYAIPQKKSDTEINCSPTLKTGMEVQKNTFEYDVRPRNGTLSQNVFGIFTGCYYLVMRNNNNRTFIKPFGFVETDYPFYDKKFRFGQNSTRSILEDNMQNGELIDAIEISALCISINAKLKLWKGENRNISSGRNLTPNAEVTGDCRISYSAGVQPKCTVKNITEKSIFLKVKSGNEIVSVTTARSGEGWRAKLRWRKVKSGGYTYYTEYTPSMTGCDDLVKPRMIDPYSIWKWVPTATTFCIGHVEAASNKFEIKKENKAFEYSYLLGALLGTMTVIAILFLMIKYIKLCMRNENRQIGSPGEFHEVIGLSPDHKESDHILLMYARDSDRLFLEAMSSFRQRLEQECVNCKVHDVYALNEWKKVLNVQVAGWVDEWLKERSKIVWVDTPRFRLQVDNTNENNLDDSRDEAIIYALRICQDSTDDPATQYLRHFVVQVEGFDVQNGDNNPLRNFAPHRRYYIPDQLSQLCEDLKSALNSSENTTQDE